MTEFVNESLDTPEKGIEIRRQRIILLILAVVQFTNIVDFMIVMPLGPQLMRTLKIGPTQFGLIVSSYTLSAGIAGLLAATLIDRFDRKLSFLTLYLGFLVGTLFCGLAEGYPILLAARVVTGAFGGILGGLAMAIIGDVFPEHQRGAATGALMSAFALASVAGVPFGLSLGTAYGWHVPFLLLAGVGSVVLLIAVKAMPSLREHLDPEKGAGHPLKEMVATLTHPNHLRAFALIVTLMLGSFAVIPYISPYLVANVGVAEKQLPWVYVIGGGLTLIAAPLVGKLADRYGKLRVYRCAAPIAGLLMLAVTCLPQVSFPLAITVVSLLMVGNASRMIAAMAMVMTSVEPRRRGSFMTANSSIQHLSTGLGAYIGGRIILRTSDGSFQRFPWVGAVAATATILSLVLAGRLRTHGDSLTTSPALSLGAAAEALGDSSEPLAATDLA
ncbi:MFS transporter [Singulisphaera acidiphila]|uniref:Arabinose efflux permease family protein n=1 Tax=Singulisphaera acidiphila (strain ATCC BAA-1392 / DSM 18658 / VKM B-2454 / MOB10) TaxID=886293 RepID=L0DM96_SINAD|nr:MFS transporter [Singulisphaera acidiphila]AGA29935.1 arabinose efflux permease family protein [Singulisphaera acidiphila DSM 18658]